MKSRNGGQLLVDCLKGLGATQSFGVPGESYLAVLDALHDTKGSLDLTVCRNEGGAAFMAAAYGKLTGTPGLCFVTRGPGATNASIGVHTAMQDSVPMLLFIGQVDAAMKEREAFQEIDYRAYFGSFAKWATEIESADRIPEIVARAWSTAVSGRPGPVAIGLPENVLAEQSTEDALGPHRPVEEPSPSAATIEEIASAFEKADRPLIILGGTKWSDAGRQALQSFAETNKIPVLAAFRYQDQFDNHSLSYAGDAGVAMAPATKDLIQNADLILALNIRFGEMTTGGYTLFHLPSPKQTLIHTHTSDRELGKIYVPDLAIHAGPNTVAEALATLRFSNDWSNWRDQARANYEASFKLPDQPGPVDMGEILTHLRDRLPDDAILTNGAGNFAIWPNKFFKFGPDQRLLAPQSGAMGYGLPAAIAAKTAQPDRTVVCFAGDGDFQMNGQELGTAMQSGATPIVLILNNGTYGTIRMHQERTFPGRVSGTDITNPNFCQLAQAYSFMAERVSETSQFAAAFERALASKTGAVLELMVSAEALTPRQTLSDIRIAAMKAGNGG